MCTSMLVHMLDACACTLHASAHASQMLSGLAGATLSAPSMALVLGMATPLRKGTAALVMLALRGVGALLGSVGTIVLISQA